MLISLLVRVRLMCTRRSSSACRRIRLARSASGAGDVLVTRAIGKCLVVPSVASHALFVPRFFSIACASAITVACKRVACKRSNSVALRIEINFALHFQCKWL